ncbi:hypothetical protein PPERSA_05029 [Pseudocohnilembus persalinus]|uniref:Uncharacterized protein n=1 Tax=Pseudocohnilembus persalinus TaxID=266149 RepID=A0A0V0QWN4_PSEPJ|nr:hypothetical protein PPERSA_05029 [Pseudocohnilembus persalinus]|eukprot:KRX06416.1 hypothetical protein PPERSA_05029 [Pseudocohnilembus persalinus]
MNEKEIGKIKCKRCKNEQSLHNYCKKCNIQFGEKVCLECYFIGDKKYKHCSYCEKCTKNLDEDSDIEETNLSYLSQNESNTNKEKNINFDSQQQQHIQNNSKNKQINKNLEVSDIMREMQLKNIEGEMSSNMSEEIYQNKKGGYQPPDLLDRSCEIIKNMQNDNKEQYSIYINEAAEKEISYRRSYLQQDLKFGGYQSQNQNQDQYDPQQQQHYCNDTIKMSIQENQIENKILNNNIINEKVQDIYYRDYSMSLNKQKYSFQNQTSKSDISNIQNVKSGSKNFNNFFNSQLSNSSTDNNNLGLNYNSTYSNNQPISVINFRVSDIDNISEKSP